VSDIHFDIRPAFAQHRDQSGTSWADLVDAWALSFELAVAKSESAIFAIALEKVGLEAGEVLMVGDRGPWDGAGG
jgi:FMN phosphatase YigB (HAD superfamily)